MSLIVPLDSLPELVHPVVTMGSFDGLHRGHQKILSQVREAAKRKGGHSVLISFEPHPRRVLFPHLPLSLITPGRQKTELLGQMGLDYIVIAPFTESFSRLSARDYVDQFLVRHFHPSQIVIGYDHRFGHDREGDIHLLRSLADTYGYEVREISAELIDEAAISSTKIRRCIEAGELETAADMLGRPYAVWGKVVRGAEKGRELGYPTANLSLLEPEQLLPSPGVYAARVGRRGQAPLGAMANLGFRPTLYSDGQLQLEAHLFDFDGDLYGETLELTFVSRIREEVRFQDLDALKAQLALDEVEARRRLGQAFGA